MKSCDDCPGSAKCSGQNLHPVLVRVFDLYAAGVTDKFDILFALGEDDEALLERYSVHVSSDCWTKAALLAIVEVMARLADAGTKPADITQRVAHTILTARDAFSRFPWSLDELVAQAPDLYALIVEKCPDDLMGEALTKRAFVKMCKDIAYA